ncbi:MAG: hypothetical protein M1830_009837 [Pleopsidium flavum]|nr:MAG: hypothetical protein M1830_009837 [Pleopsidium flavum]
MGPEAILCVKLHGLGQLAYPSPWAPYVRKTRVSVPEQLKDRRVIENLMQREWHAQTSKEQVQIGREAASEFHKVMEQKWERLGPALLLEKEYAAELEKRRAEGRPDNEYETGGSVAFMVHTFALLEPPTALERVIQRAIAMS